MDIHYLHLIDTEHPKSSVWVDHENMIGSAESLPVFLTNKWLHNEEESDYRINAQGGHPLNLKE